MFTELGIDPSTVLLLVLALILALAFEFVNGFHDTANAVATVIYTHSLKPIQAVIWSGTWNFIGVLTSSGAVAFGIVALLPVELVLNVGSGAGFAMIFALLLSAIIWNLGTWYLGLPASSSHTLIGSIVGVGLMNSYLTPGSTLGEGVNWSKVLQTGEALVFSPIIGFFGAALLLLLARATIKNKALFEAPTGDAPPPLAVRLLLLLTCTGVSFAHGSNDGQKGMGLIMLIVIGMAPAVYALNLDSKPELVQQISAQAGQIHEQLSADGKNPPMPNGDARHELTEYLRKGEVEDHTLSGLSEVTRDVGEKLSGKANLSQVPADSRSDLRVEMYLLSSNLDKMAKAKALAGTGIDPSTVAGLSKNLKTVTTFIPVWVKFAVALALGLGTMVGWKRIVVTVGEKIGKAHLTYGQGASAELIAMATIEAADILGLPVSTTHVLSSGIAGTMVANGSGIQKETVRNIVLAWVLTLPVCVLLGAGLFAGGLFVFFRVIGVH